MLVIVGHGPSIVGKGLGEWIDQQTVIRLKGAPMPNAEDWGTRTDVISTTKPCYLGPRILGAEYWIFGPPEPGFRRPDVERWQAWFQQFLTTPKRRKPSNGLCAVMTAVEFLKPQKIGLIGFDSMLYPEKNTGKWFHVKPTKWGHDQNAEHNALFSLDTEVIDLCS